MAEPTLDAGSAVAHGAEQRAGSFASSRLATRTSDLFDQLAQALAITAGEGVQVLRERAVLSNQALAPAFQLGVLGDRLSARAIQRRSFRA